MHKLKEKVDLLKELSSLLEKDLITKEEFEKQKYYLLQSENWASGLFQIISLISRLLTPQLVTLAVILLFYVPLSQIIRGASEIAFGDSFSFKVQEALRVQDPKLADIVRRMTKEEIATLISTDSHLSLYSRLTVENGEKPQIGLNEKLDFYVGLQDKGLFYSDVDLSEIKEILESKEASSEFDSSDSLYGPLKQRYYLQEDFSEEELELITNAHGSLTNAGEKVYWLIIDNAASDLSEVQ